MHDERRTGSAAGLIAYGLCGIIPAYFKLLKAVPADSIVANRIAWSFPLLALALLVLKRGGRLVEVMKQPKLLLTLAASALLIAVNWLLYVYAINSGQVLAASLG